MRGQPLYPFGYGLSYSKFESSNLKLSTPQLDAGNPLAIDVDVRSASAKLGDEVVEVYVSFPKLPGEPLRALRGFTRVQVGAGEVRHVKLELQPRDLSYVNEAGDRMVTAGDYVISAGGTVNPAARPPRSLLTCQSVASSDCRNKRSLPV